MGTSGKASDRNWHVYHQPPIVSRLPKAPFYGSRRRENQKISNGPGNAGKDRPGEESDDSSAVGTRATGGGEKKYTPGARPLIGSSDRSYSICYASEPLFLIGILRHQRSPDARRGRTPTVDSPFLSVSPQEGTISGTVGHADRACQSLLRGTEHRGRPGRTEPYRAGPAV